MQQVRAHFIGNRVVNTYEVDVISGDKIKVTLAAGAEWGGKGYSMFFVGM